MKLLLLIQLIIENNLGNISGIADGFLILFLHFQINQECNFDFGFWLFLS